MDCCRFKQQIINKFILQRNNVCPPPPTSLFALLCVWEADRPEVIRGRWRSEPVSVATTLHSFSLLFIAQSQRTEVLQQHHRTIYNDPSQDNSTQNKSQTQRARATSFLSTDCELSMETCSKNVYSPGPIIKQLTTRVQSHIVIILSRAIRITRHVTCATYVRNRVCPRVELILKIIIILLIIFLGFIKSKPC